MKKNKNILIIIAVILVLGLIIFLLTRKEKPFNQLNIPITNVVTNKIDKDYIVPIINAGLYQLKIDSVFIIVKPMSEYMVTNGLGVENFELKGTLMGNRQQFMLYLNVSNRSEAISIISHELIHLTQYHSGRLVKREGFNSVLWEGLIVDVKEVPYLERPWEKEAFSKDKDLEKKIYNMLLK